MIARFVLRFLFVVCLILVADFASAQSPSNINYPLASCIGGTCPSPTTVQTHITASYFDTINEVVYIGGKFNDLGGNTRNGLAAINAVNGTLLSWSPVVNNGTVTAIAKSGDTVFVGGTFTLINGQTRNRIAALSASTGALFSNFNSGTSASTDTVTSLLRLGDKLYVGGKFTSIASSARTNLARFSLNGTIDNWIVSTAFPGTVKKITFFGNTLAVLAYNPAGPNSEIDAVNISTAVRTVRAQSDPGELITDFALRGSVAFLVGPFFSVNTIPRTTTAACDLANGTLSAWNPQPALGGYDTRSGFHIEYYRDSLYIGVCDVSSILPAYHKIYVSHYTAANLRVLKTYQSNLSGLNGYYNDELLAGNARLIEIERFAQHTSFPNGSVNCRIYSYCMRPPTLPGPFTLAPTQVCPGDTNIIYTVQPQSYFSTYTWQPMNPGIVPTGNTNSVSVDFLETYNVTSTLRVYGVTSCGTSTSIFRSIAISPLPVPDANSGMDDTLNCIDNQLTLHGTSITPGATFQWNWSTGSSNTDSLIVSSAEQYVLTVHGPNGCWKRDTVLIASDTIPPSILAFGTVPEITCRDTSVTLDASSLYPTDSLRWSGPGLISPANPALVNQSGNFLLTVHDFRNGCENSDTIFVGQDIAVPPASIVAPDTVITCATPAVLLDAFSDSANIIFSWTDSSSTVFSNPFLNVATGFFQLHAIDTINGCENSANLILISSWTTPPGLNPIADSVFLNCSYDSLIVPASSLTIGSAILWSGPSSYSANDSAIVSQTGYYFVNAIHPQNGCISSDSVYVGFTNSLEISAGNDTIICPGSGAVLIGSVVGGSSPFNYAWSNGAGNTSPVTVYPADTLAYALQIDDAAGCIGFDTVIVFVPAQLHDSVLSFQPCDPLQPTGQIQVYATGGIPPYSYSIDNGISWNANGVFANLGYGSYSVLYSDAIGCTANTTAVIDTNSLSPQPSFLISTSPQQGDTIVVVDISNPRPDSVSWDFPPGSFVTDSSMFAPAFVNTDTGMLSITMHAFYGTCEVIYTRTIDVQPFSNQNANFWNANGIDTLILYPNPNSGTFNFEVDLEAKQSFVIIVYDANGIEHTRLQISDADNWSGQITVPNPVPGNYLLRVIAEFDSAEIPFVITQ